MKKYTLKWIVEDIIEADGLVQAYEKFLRNILEEYYGPTLGDVEIQDESGHRL